MAFRNNIKQSKIAEGGWGMLQLADALRHKKGGFVSDSRRAPWKL